jgi:hypothetical protein
MAQEQPGQVADRTIRLLGWVGAGSAVSYLAVLWLSFRFRHGEGHADRPILAVLGLFGLATAGYWLALSRLVSDAAGNDRGRLRLVLGFALLFRLLLLGSSPIQEIDYYRYLWDGQVLAHGLNPFRYSPARVEEEGPSAHPGTDLSQLWQLAHRSGATRAIFTRVHHREVPTVYPPAAQVVFAQAALVTPSSAPLWAHLLVLKGLILSFDLATLVLVALLLRRLHLPASWCLAYAWCPLVIKEFANSAHLDSIAVFFTTLALYLLVRCHDKKDTSGGWKVAILAGAALGLGILAKSYPVVLLPVVGAYAIARLRWRSAWLVLGCASVVVVGYAPFAVGPQSGAAASGPWTGLGTFLGRWEMNDILFMLTYENLRPAGEQPQRWFVVVPVVWRSALNEGLARLPLTGVRPAFLLTQALLGLVLLGLCLRWAWRLYREPRPGELLRSCHLSLTWGWLLSSAPNPWYLTWGLPLMAFARLRSWWLLPGLAFLYYLRFWLEYQSLGSEESLRLARERFDFGVVWLEFVPFFLALLVESWWRRAPRPRQVEPDAGSASVS